MAQLYSISALGLLVYLILVWFLGSWLRLRGGDLWIFRIGLALIGVVAAALTILFLRKRQVQTPAAPAGQAGLQKDVRFLVREANSRLAQSRAIHKAGRKLADVPLVLFLGDTGSAKTTLIVNSGLTPELLAGQAYQDNTIVPTRAANFWLGSGTVFVEAGGELTADTAALSSLVRLLRGRRLANLFGRSAQSPRSVVLCCDCANFNAPEARNTLAATARKYQTILGDVAQNWGSRVPIYVLCSKLDQVSYFADFVRFFSNEESTQTFGVTLPLSSPEPAGAYNDQQTRRLSEAFESLFFSLADKRIDCLRRENDPSKPPNVYEFPREFRKMRENLVRFLLEVGRPSQLRATPFLRGFYFTGVRPVVVEEPAGAAAPVPSEPYGGDPAATRLFSQGFGQIAAAQPAIPQVPGVRRVPEWVFLRQFFSALILGDRLARGASGRDTRSSLIRRALFTTAAGAFLIWLIGATVSFFRNHDLVEGAADAVRTLAAVRSTPGQALPLDALRQLDRLREAAATVTHNQRDRAPMSFRWGMYPGTPLYENTRAVYCREFGRLMLSGVRGTLEAYLRGLPLAPGPSDDYERPFRSLKAYLMMTSRRDKADAGFLASALTDQWAAGRSVTPEQRALAREQFTYYGNERTADLCAARADADTLAQARRYLLGFQRDERIYRGILADVMPRGPSVSFRDPSGAVIDRQEVTHPYTKAGWPRVQAAIRDEAKYLSRDPWVLEEGLSSPVATQELQLTLRRRYVNDYIAQWQQFLNAAAISGYGSFRDAAGKLDAVTSPRSALLSLFCLISVNTAITEAPDIIKEFQPIQSLEPPATCSEKPSDAPSQQYMSELARLQFQVDAIARKPDQSDATLDAVGAKMAARQTAQNLNLSPKAGRLLQDPILYAEALVERAGPQALNGKGASFCGAANAGILSRFPFRKEANEEVKLDDFNRFFQPGNGELWKFYEESLRDLIAWDGARYSRKPGAKLSVTSDFLGFFSRAAAVSHAFYPNSGARPSLNYTVRAGHSDGVDSFVLSIDGNSLRGSGRGGELLELIWPGEGGIVALEARGKFGRDGLSKSGLWGFFLLLGEANNVSGNVFEYYLSNQSTFGRKKTSLETQQGTLRLQVEAKTVPGLFGMMQMKCVGKIAQ